MWTKINQEWQDTVVGQTLRYNCCREKATKDGKRKDSGSRFKHILYWKKQKMMFVCCFEGPISTKQHELTWCCRSTWTISMETEVQFKLLVGGKSEKPTMPLLWWISDLKDWNQNQAEWDTTKLMLKCCLGHYNNTQAQGLQQSLIVHFSYKDQGYWYIDWQWYRPIGVLLGLLLYQQWALKGLNPGTFWLDTHQ